MYGAVLFGATTLAFVQGTGAGGVALLLHWYVKTGAAVFPGNMLG